MKNLINYLFNKGYFPREHKKETVPKAIFTNPDYAPFKEALMHEVCKWMAEELELKGNISAQYEVYQRLLFTFTSEKEVAHEKYVDPLKLIEKEAKESIAKRNNVL